MEALCKCPVCGGDVTEKEKLYGCNNFKDSDGGCQAKVWKNTRGHDVTAEEAKALFEGCTLENVTMLTREGKTYLGDLIFVDGKVDMKVDDSAVCKCPDCGDDIVDKGRFFGCKSGVSRDQGCQTKIWKTERGHNFTREEAATLFSGGTLENVEMVAKSGNPYTGNLRYVDGKLEMKFAENDSFVKIADCPTCGGDILDRPKSYGCSNYKSKDEGCQTVVFKNLSGHAVTKEEAISLFKGETLKQVKMFSESKGADFTSDVAIVDGKVSFIRT